ncbi:dephospho-CoA kinase [Ruminococcus sp.]|uniref:dephospho-CoA kinase n=1 Tax=Ruminococcus sp. TaxID=41978 RepID=UPI00261A0942|nr:dephospho-CoA kinase [Ruminococcus sp.]MDD6989568.1 dephospho-CoA kinase [Ruminococcus sp.]MDY6201762.1 dephospho-CoA kinase [Ruminococcus sp.]
MKKCRILGLTGQSGAGKSTVAEFLEQNGFYVISADLLVKKIYNSGSPCLKTIAAVFGEDIISDNGTPDRKLLAKRAFSSKENTALLSSIVHPFVTAELFTQIKKAAESGATTVVYDAPQLFESNADVICDEIISVTAEKSVRLQRICKRDNISKENALMRMNAQLDEEFFRENSDYIIENNSDLSSLNVQLESLLKQINS